MSKPSHTNQHLRDLDAKFDSFKSNFTVPILKDQHLVFIETVNRYINTFLSTGVPSHLGAKNDTTGFREASPKLRLLSSKAIHRLDLWINTLVFHKHHPDRELPLPPLDVLIMLNAYMLSPRPFLEDLRVRDLPQLQTFPIKEIASRIHNNEYKATPHDIESWMHTVRVPFDIAQMAEFIDITCPRCARHLRVNWEESSGKGYGQAAFETTCPSCPTLVVNHDALCAGKFLTDFKTCQHDQKSVLQGTLLDQNGVRDSLEGGRFFLNELVNILGKAPRNELGDQISWSMETIVHRVESAKDTRLHKKSVRALLRPYRNSSPFTADLVDKAFSYIDFTEYFREDGWFDGSMDEDFKGEVLIAGIAEYLKFVRIAAETNKTSYVSHEVDVVWHAHQLIGAHAYREQSIQVTGGLLDHLPISHMGDTLGVST
ncbi:hypothetical protein FRB96_009485 [Tulasnella sp. 330]|nr:hypothetical protein FRB96_009485 [Tulasnella sp. 330]KAG8874395.1 hypothetical protein FRB97_005956 [Tulasnella sp. 331]KAG8879134.1 hypothetical protein FRB98_005854 [Tulasnella sp. 332]